MCVKLILFAMHLFKPEFASFPLSYRVCLYSGGFLCPVTHRSIRPLHLPLSAPHVQQRPSRSRKKRACCRPLHLHCSLSRSPPHSCPSWSLRWCCKRGSRCCRLPTHRTRRPKFVSSRSASEPPRAATAPSARTPPSRVASEPARGSASLDVRKRVRNLPRLQHAVHSFTHSR